MASQAAGIDISDRSIELVAFHPKGEGTIVGVTRIELPAGIISRGEIQDYDELLKRVKILFDTTFGLKRGKINVGASLPETAVYTKVFRMPAGLEDSHYKKALQIEANEEFPYDLSSAMTSSFISVQVTEDSHEFLFSTVESRLAQDYERLLIEAGTNPVFLEPESSSLARGVMTAEDSVDALLADIGARTTMLVALGTKGEPVLSSAVPIGGDMLTSAVETLLKMSLEDAEMAKRRGGFDARVDDGRMMMILQSPFEEISNEINTTINYYNEKTGREIKKIVLAGGTSLLPSITDYVSSRFGGVEVVRANLISRFQVSPKAKLPANFKDESVLYATAAGLAVRATGTRDRPGPNLLPSARGHSHGHRGPLNFIRSLFKKSLRPMSPTKKSTPRKKASPKKKATKSTAKKSSKPSGEMKPVIESPEVIEETAVVVKPEVTENKAEAMADLNKIVEAEDSVLIEEPVVMPERDFGMGVGDILSGSSESDEEDEQGDEHEEGKKMSIEAILQGRSTSSFDDSSSGYEEDDYGTIEEEAPPRKRRLRKSALIPLVVFILALLLIAQGTGMFGGAGRSSSSKVLSYISSLFGGSKQVEQTGDSVDAQPSVPSIVSMNVLITSVEDEEEVAVPVVASRIIETDVTATDSFQATGEAPAEEARAVGSITVVNETSNDYKFVPTTRFLSADGILYRLKNSSDIPANGTAEVEVYADEVGASGDIGPARFTIPGLGKELEQYVYGRSRTAMTGGSGTVAAVKEEDIESARKELLDRLFDEARENFKAMISAGELVLGDLITSNEVDSTLPEEGKEGATFDVTLKVQFSTLVVPEAELITKLTEKMFGELPEGAVITDYEIGTILHTVEAFDTTSGRAEIRIEAPIQKIQ